MTRPLWPCHTRPAYCTTMAFSFRYPLLALSALFFSCCSTDTTQITEPPLSFDGTSVSPDSPESNGCRQLETGRIRIEDPSLLATYDLNTLGVVQISSDGKDITPCIDAAIQDGAEIISQDSDRITVLYPTRFESFLDAARDRINMDAVEGRWNNALNKALPGVSGRRILEPETRAAFIQAVQNQSDSFPIIIEEIPALSSNPEEYADFRPTVLISEYRTIFSKSKPRTTNVKLAASSCDGTFLMPGAVFSYNSWVGERSEARGFKEAPVIEQGQLVEGLGGGACQVSSTIHAAALLAGLGIIERSNHSLPSSYIPVGLDAVVSYPLLDLRIRNTLSRPVVLRVHIEDNTLIAQIFSDAPQTARVMFRSEIAEEVPFKETITVDPALAPGAIKFKKKGKVGYKVQRGRIFIENGKERYEKLYMDTYQSQMQQTIIAPDVIYPEPVQP